MRVAFNSLFFDPEPYQWNQGQEGELAPIRKGDAARSERPGSLQVSIFRVYSSVVATSVHIPDNLLKEVDRRAKTLKMSRNRYIVEALRKVLADQTSWSAPFLEQLDRLAPVEGVDELLDGIKARRTRKGPPKL